MPFKIGVKLIEFSLKSDDSIKLTVLLDVDSKV